MKEQGFSLTTYLAEIGGVANSTVQAQFENLAAIEKNAVGLMKFMEARGYASPVDLHEELLKQPLPAVDAGYLAAFLAGVYAAKSYDSAFMTEAFGGSMMSLHEGTDRQVKQTLGALLTVMRACDMDMLPSRLHLAKSDRPRVARAKPRSAVRRERRQRAKKK